MALTKKNKFADIGGLANLFQQPRRWAWPVSVILIGWAVWIMASKIIDQPINPSEVARRQDVINRAGLDRIKQNLSQYHQPPSLNLQQNPFNAAVRASTP